MAYPMCCGVSNVFLLLTLAAYASLPSLREPLFGKIIMAFVTALFFAYTWTIVTALSHLRLVSNRDEAGEEAMEGVCKALGFLVQFSFLTTFFWMNVLSYDIFRKFTRFRCGREYSFWFIVKKIVFLGVETRTV